MSTGEGSEKVCWVLKWREDGHYLYGKIADSNVMGPMYDWGWARAKAQRFASVAEAMATAKLWRTGATVLVKLTRKPRPEGGAPQPPREVWVRHSDAGNVSVVYCSTGLGPSWHRYVLAATEGT